MNLLYLAGSLFVANETNHSLKEADRGILIRILGVIVSMMIWPILVLGRVIRKLFRG